MLAGKASPNAGGCGLDKFWGLQQKQKRTVPTGAFFLPTYIPYFETFVLVTSKL